MARTYSGSNYSHRTTGAVAALPLTVSLWSRKTGATGAQLAFNLVDTTSALSYFRLYSGLGSAAAGITIQDDASVSNSLFHTNQLTSGVWSHLCGTATNAAKAFYLDGIQSLTGTGTSAPASMDRIVIAAQWSSGFTATYTGDLADVAMWNIELAYEEVLALSRGVSPWLIRPSGLVGFWPLQGNASYLNNFVKNATTLVLTAVGGVPAVSDHAPTQALWVPTPIQSARLFAAPTSASAATSGTGAASAISVAFSSASSAAVGTGTAAGVGATPTFSYLRPDADDTDGGWTNELGGTNLFPSIDESVPNDADYIQSSDNPSGDICRFRLSNATATLTPPGRLRIRYARSGVGSVDLTIRLKQGSTEIASWVLTDISDTITTTTQTLTTGQYAAITDFDDLFIELQAD